MKFIGIILIIISLFASAPHKTSKVYGIDVSHHQGNIDWTKVKSWNSNELKFVYIKATEGSSWVDPNYKANIKGANKTKLLVGSYHYFRTTSSPEAQFKNFISVVDTSKQDLVPLIDLEERNNWDANTYHKNLKKFLSLVEKHFGKKPILYTVNSFYNKNLSYKYMDYEILVGRYGANPPLMIDLNSWAIWQFSETGRVKGIPKNVDINVVNSSFDIKSLRK